ncbi:uncharacterized protein LOC143040436 [Oratosquilla oratoria]|uniref:uncharacterized protein LOC143040436 n=1 Tax=Oratosquilla oratoria TaxID=337810 RepID=UPI003F771F57
MVGDMAYGFQYLKVQHVTLRLVVDKLGIGKPKERIKKKQKRLRLERLKDEETKQTLQRLIELRKPAELEMGEMSIEEQWGQIKETVYGAAEETVGIKIKYGTKNKNTARWTDVKVAVKEKTRSFRKWMKKRDIGDKQVYEDKRNNGEAIKRTAKEEMWIRIGQNIERDVQGTRKLLYSMAKNYRKGNNETTYAVKDKTGTELLTEPKEIEERWREYFEELLNVEDMEVEEERNVEIQQEQHGEDLNEITIQEVKEALKKMRSGKAPGDDELPIELFKAAGEGPNRSTIDLVFTQMMILEKSREWDIYTCVAFIDLEKAFDRINRTSLWSVTTSRLLHKP